jgi:hypothetical protein
MQRALLRRLSAEITTMAEVRCEIDVGARRSAAFPSLYVALYIEGEQPGRKSYGVPVLQGAQ